MDHADICGILQTAVRLAGSERAWALAHDVPIRSVGMFLDAHRPPSDAILRALGITKEVTVTYRMEAGRNRNAA